ncbi:MAG: hypothetical protein ABIH04_05880, partial [Planctomycetota bacterium]
MDFIFAILFIGSVVALILGLQNPSSVIRWGSKKSKGQVIIVYGLAAFIFLVLFIAASSPSQKKETTADEQKQDGQQERRL